MPLNNTSNTPLNRHHTLLLGKKIYNTVVFQDVTKAFNKVWHPSLLFKLKSFLPSSYYLFFISFLSEQFFSARPVMEYSNISPILSGNLLGSVASPALFNLYSANQPTHSNTQIAVYADDNVIFSTTLILK